MQRKKSRNLELVQRLFIYLLMVVTVAALLIVLTLTVTGYRFNFSTNQVEQTGLVQYDSYPRTAMVKVDGRNYETTQTKGLVLPGQRQFSMNLKGYEDWQKTLQVEPGTVTWLSYIRLIPIERKVETVATLANFSNTVTSPDRRFIAGIASTPEGSPELSLIDFRDSRLPKVNSYPIDTAVLSGYDESETEVAHSFSIVRWSQSGRYLLLNHKYTLPDQPTKTEWLWVDRESPKNLTNISTLLGLNLNEVHFADGRDVYLLQDNGDVRRASVGDGTISRPLLSGVTWFEVFDANTISYLGTSLDKRVAGVWQRDWQEPTVLMSVPDISSQQIHIRVSKYFNKDTVAVSDGSAVSIYRGSLPRNNEAKDLFTQTPKKFTLGRPVSNLQFSDNGRFLLAEDAQGVVSYDIERLTVSQEFDKYNDTPIKWLDGYHLWQSDKNGELVMQEFDGLNSHEMMSVNGGHDVILSRDDKFLYSLQTTEDGKLKLNQLSMTVDGAR